jgi:hypothetical protein
MNRMSFVSGKESLDVDNKEEIAPSIDVANLAGAEVCRIEKGQI